MSDTLISAERVREILADCLFRTDELSEGEITQDNLPDDAVVVEGIMNTYAFHRERLESHRDEITTMLQNLPLLFRPTEIGGGGGWSFLNACDDVNGVQWTGFHLTMEGLFVLGIALDLAAWALPRDLWAAFPGGMPYVLVKV